MKHLTAIGLVLLIFGGCVLLCVPYQTMWDDGMRDCSFRFLVLDAKTRQPLRGVRIAIYDEAPSTWKEMRTCDNGVAVIDLPCMISCTTRSSILFSQATRSIYYPDRVLIISRSGYKDHALLNLTDLVGRWCVGEYRPPAPVQIELEPE